MNTYQKTLEGRNAQDRIGQQSFKLARTVSIKQTAGEGLQSFKLARANPAKQTKCLRATHIGVRAKVQLILGIFSILSQCGFSEDNPRAGENTNEIFCVRHAESNANTFRGKVGMYGGMVLSRLLPDAVKRIARNPFLSSKGYRQALDQGKELISGKEQTGNGSQNRESTSNGFLYSKDWRTVGNISSPLNRTVQTWFMMMTPFVKEKFGTWQNAINNGFILTLTPNLREAQDGGNQDSYGPPTMKLLREQLTKAIKKCIAFLKKETNYIGRPKYANNFFPNKPQLDELRMFDLEIMYTGYGKAYNRDYKLNEMMHMPNHKLKKFLDIFHSETKRGWWRWDNRRVRKGQYNPKWRENDDPEVVSRLLTEIKCSMKDIADLRKETVIVVSHGQKLSLLFKEQVNLELVNPNKNDFEVENAQGVPLKLKFDRAQDGTVHYDSLVTTIEKNSQDLFDKSIKLKEGEYTLFKDYGNDGINAEKRPQDGFYIL